MPQVHKTFNVEAFKTQVNAILRTSIESSDFRLGIQLLAEQIFHDTNSYYGFRYLTADEVPEGELPGINKEFVGDYDAQFENTDRTRICYF